MFKSFIVLLTPFLLFANTIEKAINEKEKINKDSLQVQKKIDTLDEKTKQLVLEYKKLSSQLENQKKYNNQLTKIINSQNQEKSIVNKNIQEIDNTSKNIYPLMEKMIFTLEEFIKLDTPFLVEERLKRVEKLKSIINSSQMSVSNKYRTIMESYMIENGYSNTIESYSGEINGKVVDFLRLGRVSLYYVSKDNTTCGIYDKNKKSFINLDNSNIKHIKKAIKIAKKQLAPDLIVLPVDKG